jgi:hypothetical protein
VFERDKWETNGSFAPVGNPAPLMREENVTQIDIPVQDDLREIQLIQMLINSIREGVVFPAAWSMR